MNKLIIIVIAINLALAGGQLWLSASRSSDGSTLATVETQLAQIKTENWRLKDQIYTHSALTQIDQWAQAETMAAVKPQFASVLPVANTATTP